MPRRPRLAVLAVVAALAALGVAVPGPSTASAATGLVPTGAARAGRPGATVATAPAAQVWVTTADGTLRLQQTATVTGKVSSRTPSSSIRVRPDVVGQQVTGFGATLTHASAELLAALPPAERDRVLRELFDPRGPVRLSVVRVPLGASDFTSTPATTFDDVPAPGTDWDLTAFSTAADEGALRPVLRQVLAINPDVTVIASPWSAPAWLKESGSLYGGRLSADARAVPTYAEYLVRALQEYAVAGVPVDLLTVQNEPQTRWSADYPRMEMPVATQVALVGALEPRLAAAGLGTQVLAFDHNWAQHPADLAAVPLGTDPEDDYAARVLAASGPVVVGVGYHCYSGDASAQSTLHTEHPAAQIWVTECSGSHGPADPPAQVFADTLMWQGQHLLLASLRHWATGVLTFNVALDPSGGPHVGGCTTCTGVVTVDGATTTANAEYHVLAHAARFLTRGATRIGSTGTSTGLDHVAFRGPDGAVTVLLQNRATRAASTTVLVDGLQYAVTVPARALATVHRPTS